MQRVWVAALALALAGVTVSCASWRAKKAEGQKPLLVTPDLSLTGRVVSVNLVGRFVVLTFPSGRLPAIGQVLSVYRDGLKVGEVRVSGPQRDDHIVADIAAGEVRVGDQVRSP
ncbi:hypothetical protein [Limisphaera sp. VF-2]|uniref:hypothetical protein n=1 Tax=Limisphaera sp. VF-2 TaxID=3400418 RepID=UPI001754C744|nr:hypothetical protein [Limisphaera sp.]